MARLYTGRLSPALARPLRRRGKGGEGLQSGRAPIFRHKRLLKYAMRVGTKSLLFGVHNVLWHPITVWLAWVHLNKAFPRWWECVAIFTHDLGYWGKPDMDGEEGRQHPVAGANLAYLWTYNIARFFGMSHPDANGRAYRAWKLSIGHSRYYA